MHTYYCPHSQGDFNSHAFAHPIDLHFACSSLKDWPKISVEVWSHDSFGRNILAGYGCCFVPTSPGMHHVDCVMWLPEGTFMDRVRSLFLGTSASLNHIDIVHSDVDRLELNTKTMGIVHLDLQVMLLDFKGRGTQFNSIISKDADLRLLGSRAIDKLYSEDQTEHLGKYIRH